MTTYASATDVRTLLARELTTEETALVERRLEQVERMILRKIPDLSIQIDNELLDADDVVDIEAEAVCRVLRNPEGLLQEQDGSYGYRLNPDAADNSLRILPEEWLVLGIRPSKAFALVPNITKPYRGASFGSGG
ncbi:Gp19/Gp15/Gp42 family protein [Gordonia amicalis]|uniref:Gp19/Gp15/Gp42 family protein n=1 Tax=Gordonia amicalis TaxID=89053 RepID=A0ABU4DMQ4_9ACTN|nr:Gp19/Gp15/Gp42 family protein [Gordonia amicalis]MDV6310276.1 Gp19/Gp15/Gp42 family protein [Gordonia amicalis]MDV7100337.1 Gp19/Gp15/Gp42 family protein [Gordonia amicalis]